MSEPPVVSALIETFTSMLADKVLEEVSLVTSFKSDFEFLCDELVSVKLLLVEAGQNSTSRSMSNWLEKLEYFLYDAVDIVDQCRARKFGNSIFSNFEKLIFRYKMGGRFRTLRERIHNIHGSAKYLKHLMCVLQVNAFKAHKLEDKRERYTAEGSEIVGREKDIDEITQLILKENGPQVIAVVSMAGIGKTSLVKRVFKSQRVQESFQHHVWLTTSQDSDAKQLLLQIVRKLKVSGGQNQNRQNVTSEGSSVQNHDATAEEIKEKIIEDLENSRSLFVLDNLWDKGDFHNIGLSSLKRTKIVVTTRDRRVVDSTPFTIHSLDRLSEQYSKKLFYIHAFPERAESTETEYSPPKDLKSVAERIVKKCGGLPLAVKTIAASTARVRRIRNDWELILKDLNESESMSDEVQRSLRLSYEALPRHLKLCFEYCSCFPKNTPLKSEYMVHAWISEGFIPQTVENPYDVGLSYIDELIDRCLLEVSKVGGDKRVKYCKMHELLHDLAHSESHKKTKCFLKPGKELEGSLKPGKELEDSLKPKELEKIRMGQGLRRISLIKNNIAPIQKPISSPLLRTLLLCNNAPLKSISPCFFSDMKYLAVLDLSQTSIKSLPETVGYLKHLKFLNLSKTEITNLPRSLAEVRSLQFLDVSKCENLDEMHSGIGEHKSMLHLNVKGSRKLESLPLGISKLIYLHTLKGLVFKRENTPSAKPFPLCTALKMGKAGNAKALQWRDLKKLTRLQHLSLTLVAAASSSEGIFPLEDGTFEDMTNMRALSLKYIDSSEGSRGILQLPKDIQFMQRLEILHLKSCAVQHWIYEFENLMELELYEDNGSPQDYRGLEKIPNLRKLKLSSNVKCVEFPREFREAGAFPKLENFVIKHFDSLEKFPSLQDGAFPMLKCLQMKYCKRLKDINKVLQIRSTIILEEIRVKECPEWVNGICKDESTWQQLKHLPIKLTINGYTVSWALSQYENFISYQKFRELGKTLKVAILTNTAALYFTAGSNASRVQPQVIMEENKDKRVTGVTGTKKEEQASSSKF